MGLRVPVTEDPFASGLTVPSALLAEARGTDEVRRRIPELSSRILPCLYGCHQHPLVTAADLAVSSPAALANRRGSCLGIRLTPRAEFLEKP